MRTPNHLNVENVASKLDKCNLKNAITLVTGPLVAYSLTCKSTAFVSKHHNLPRDACGHPGLRLPNVMPVKRGKMVTTTSEMGISQILNALKGNVSF